MPPSPGSTEPCSGPLLSVYLIDLPCALDEGMPTAMDLTILVIVPLTMAVLASWYAGRIVAGW